MPTTLVAHVGPGAEELRYRDGKWLGPAWLTSWATVLTGDLTGFPAPAMLPAPVELLVAEKMIAQVGGVIDAGPEPYPFDPEVFY